MTSPLRAREADLSEILARAGVRDAAGSAKLRVLDLFSGIGGFSLGLERTGGFETVAFCEIDPFCRHVLAKHWPNVRQYEDVKTLTAGQLAADGIAVDILCGGFPCQDISIAGSGRGLAGERSGLWSEYLRLIRELRPAYAVIENSPKLRTRGLDEVLSGLRSIWYHARWDCIPAAYAGAPHRRDRIWIVAHREEDALGPYADCLRSYFAEVDFVREAQLRHQQDRHAGPVGWWGAEPGVPRVVDGVPSRLDINRLRGTGNAVVPQLVERIGRAILESAMAAAVLSPEMEANNG